MPVDPKRVAQQYLESAGSRRNPFFEPYEDLSNRNKNQERPFNPWTAPSGTRRPSDPEKGSYEAYVARKKQEGQKPLSKPEWERAIRQHKLPID